TLHHEAEYEDKWVEDKAAWDEEITTTDPELGEYVTKEEPHAICNCGLDLTANGITGDAIGDHMEAHALKGEPYGGHYTALVPVEWIMIVHHEAEGHTEHILVKEAYDEQKVVEEAYDERVLIKEAYDEQILIKAAYDETIVTGYKCSGCGTTK
ncbi:MAG: hypothetical protein IJK56_08115, partial [Firmicutes bacterium]|nr:hypothetical protein [Bacillota bacterium]